MSETPTPEPDEAAGDDTPDVPANPEPDQEPAHPDTTPSEDDPEAA